jgi:hypothetical protein
LTTHEQKRKKKRTYIAIPITARLSRTAYQNMRLNKMGGWSAELFDEGVGRTIDKYDGATVQRKTHCCVDLTMEKPLFSRVWNLPDIN